MKLQKLKQTDFKSIKGKKICCIGKSITYLDELCDSFMILEQIAYIIDVNFAKHNEFYYRGKKIFVGDFNNLNKINFENTVIIILDDYYKEVFERLASKQLKKGHPSIIYYYLNNETEYELWYKSLYKGEKLKDIIVFRSGPHKSQYVKGMDFSDNAKAIFEYLIENEYNKKYQLVWFVKEPDKYKEYSKLQNVLFKSYENAIADNELERKDYYYYLFLAKYIFFTDAYGFARNCREDQIRVQLWHGCGFKTRLNFSRCEKRYEYTTVTSELYANIHAKIFGLRKDQVLITGCAKQDWLFRPIKDWKEVLLIPNASKYIFWLPTYRYSDEKLSKSREGYQNELTGLPLMDSTQNLDNINQLLCEKDIILIIKLHPFQDKKSVFCGSYSNIIMINQECLYEKNIEINQLLGHADALISDYSSVAVDYMLLDRPMAFAIDDLDEYKYSRGFIFDNVSDWLPGRLLFSFEDIFDFINKIANNKDEENEKRRALFKLMHKNTKTNYCEQIVKTLGITNSK